MIKVKELLFSIEKVCSGKSQKGFNPISGHHLRELGYFLIYACLGDRNYQPNRSTRLRTKGGYSSEPLYEYRYKIEKTIDFALSYGFYNIYITIRPLREESTFDQIHFISIQTISRKELLEVLLCRLPTLLLWLVLGLAGFALTFWGFDPEVTEASEPRRDTIQTAHSPPFIRGSHLICMYGLTS